MRLKVKEGEEMIFWLFLVALCLEVACTPYMMVMFMPVGLAGLVAIAILSAMLRGTME